MMTASPRGATAAPPISRLPAELLRRGAMLVDDQRLQREWNAELLRELGVLRLFEAADGAQALELLTSMREPPALILLDLEMPHVDGFETLRQLGGLDLDLGIVVVSGGNAAVLDALPALAEELGAPLLGSLPKPVDLARLAELLQKLEAPRPRRSTVAASATASICRNQLEAALAAAWIQPDYQPKIGLHSGRVEGVEALARWREPGGRQVSPAQFIPLAEQQGLIEILTLRMLSAVVDDVAGHPLLADSPLRISINVSATSLSIPGFAEQLRARIERRGLAPARFILEITESAVASDPVQALCSLGRLRLQGFGLALDDYGTGFSSLQQLARMPFSELKIDRSFVSQAAASARQRTILESAIDVGRRLGLDTVAEGVETMEDLALLRQLNCSQAQGFLFARPMPLAALLDWLAAAPGILPRMLDGLP